MVTVASWLPPPKPSPMSDGNRPHPPRAPGNIPHLTLRHLDPVMHALDFECVKDALHWRVPRFERNPCGSSTAPSSLRHRPGVVFGSSSMDDAIKSIEQLTRLGATDLCQFLGLWPSDLPGK
ncbi:hypothetical protein GYB14_15830 [bacterium]|nr:hypothetical protein [bacterium]